MMHCDASLLLTASLQQQRASLWSITLLRGGRHSDHFSERRGSRSRSLREPGGMRAAGIDLDHVQRVPHLGLDDDADYTGMCGMQQ